MEADQTGSTAPTRRRGAELDAALLDSAWSELRETGYARMTMASVAARARTSEPVLYRRWANKDQLVVAALQHIRAANPIPVPDTGDLRTDLTDYLVALSDTLAGFYAIAAAALFSGLSAGIGASPAQIREHMMQDELPADLRTVYHLAVERGELTVDDISEVVLAMPFDLVRHDMLMTLAPVPPTRVQEIVDELFIPLLRARRALREG